MRAHDRWSTDVTIIQAPSQSHALQASAATSKINPLSLVPFHPQQFKSDSCLLTMVHVPVSRLLRITA